MSVKVFPLPAAWGTLRVQAEGVADAVALMGRLATAPFELEALDLEPPGSAAGAARRARRTRSSRGCGASRASSTARRSRWPTTTSTGARRASSSGRSAATSLAQGRRSPRARCAALDARLGELPRRYARGGAPGAGSPPRPRELDGLLQDCGLSGVALRGARRARCSACADGGAFAARLRAALDPDGRFLEV